MANIINPGKGIGHAYGLNKTTKPGSQMADIIKKTGELKGWGKTKIKPIKPIVNPRKPIKPVMPITKPDFGVKPVMPNFSQKPIGKPVDPKTPYKPVMPVKPSYGMTPVNPPTSFPGGKIGTLNSQLESKAQLLKKELQGRAAAAKR